MSGVGSGPVDGRAFRMLVIVDEFTRVLQEKEVIDGETVARIVAEEPAKDPLPDGPI